MTINEIELYQRQVNFLEDFLAFHPDALSVLPEADKATLLKYFGIGRSSNDVVKSRLGAIALDPVLQMAATNALGAFLFFHHVQGAERLLPSNELD